MSYETQRQKVAKSIEQIIPVIKKIDIDYSKVIDEVASQTFANKCIIKEVLEQFALKNKIKIIVTIPDDEVQDWLTKEIEKEREAKKEAEEILHRKINTHEEKSRIVILSKEDFEGDK